MERNVKVKTAVDAPVMPPRLHEPAELAATIRYHVVTVRDAIRAGRIRALRFGRTWRIPHDEFEKIVSQGLPL